MTCDEFRGQKIKNTRLAWSVYGHHLPVEQYDNFSQNELETILLIEEDTGTVQKLKEALGRKHHWT